MTEYFSCFNCISRAYIDYHCIRNDLSATFETDAVAIHTTDIWVPQSRACTFSDRSDMYNVRCIIAFFFRRKTGARNYVRRNTRAGDWPAASPPPSSLPPSLPPSSPLPSFLSFSISISLFPLSFVLFFSFSLILSQYFYLTSLSFCFGYITELCFIK